MVQKGVKIIELSQASTLAKIISNKTAKQIIDFIGSSKKATASQIAKELSLPASTVHYNIKALVKGGIVDDEEFTYSQKGKTIIHYSLTNNILVIVPKAHEDISLLQSIKALVPSLIGVGLVGLGYALFSRKETLAIEESAALFAQDSAVAPLAAKSAPLPVNVSQTGISSPEFLWGLGIAAIVILTIFLVRAFVLSRKKK
ncbi:MAG: helix-turn-helix transcriptional regulator [Nanoarchaeota archaeon]|nr:helix-turn-helix transcriptional regulator [Nanoarchaeota archaeon]